MTADKARSTRNLPVVPSSSRCKTRRASTISVIYPAPPPPHHHDLIKDSSFPPHSHPNSPYPCSGGALAIPPCHDHPPSPASSSSSCLSAYVAPMDEDEAQRLDRLHGVLRHILRRLYLAPVDPSSLHRVLDIGTGVGTWARDMALMLPNSNAQVYGVDIQPSWDEFLRDIPPNLHLMYGDLLQGLIFRDARFDFTHQRNLVRSIPSSRWSDVLREHLRLLKPGGWIELHEPDYSFSRKSMDPAPYSDQLSSEIRRCCSSTGVYLDMISSLHLCLEDLGFTNVSYRRLDIPLGEWGGPTGDILKNIMSRDLEAFEASISRSLGPIAALNFEDLLSHFWEECELVKTCISLHIICAQKPSIPLDSLNSRK
ncbi:MAG: S-adenosyl-L-methionine-dependent methyltransferase [Piptocephalis tieghemiana]|nr:MAG: S-adenosyl-L-methionine-dependent methyltransferase [Piptocephalis tieghemiana]